MKALKVIGTMIVLALVIVSVVCPLVTPGENAALVALAQQGKKYVFNTEGPDTFDCSGLIMYAYSVFGMEIEHWANGIANDEQYVSFEKAEQAHVGDLIFFDTVKNKVPADHVGIWIGDNRFVHASSSGKQVMISEYDDDWKERFIWGKRLTKPADFFKYLKLTADETAEVTKDQKENKKGKKK